MIKVGNRAEIDHDLNHQIDHDLNHQMVNTHHGVKSFWACAQGNEENKWECANVHEDVKMNNFVVSVHIYAIHCY
jgi:hypothetical protein